MPRNTENLNYVITFTTEYKDKGLQQAKADLARFQASAQEALGVKAIHSGSTVQTASTKYMGYGASGRYGYISRGAAEGQVSAQIGKSYEASLAKIQETFASGSLKVNDYRKALTNLQLTYGKSVLEVDKLDKSTHSFLTTTSHLAIRAIAVIPIWMALRSVYQQLFETISGGINMIIGLDRELARIKTVTTDVSNMGDFLSELGHKAMKMSRETGVAVEDILHAFYGFKDAGLTTEIAMAGMETSVKGSIALFGDLKETAKTLTDIYVMMGDRITEVNTPQEKMNYIMSSIAVLQKTNKFELNDYMEGLKSFTGTAAAANLTLDQMTFLLAKTHNFMQRGSRGGTDLSNALRKLSQNAEKASIFLGTPINLSGNSRFELMLIIMDKLNEKMKKGQDITKNINDIFGIRGTAAINAFTINLKSVIQQWKEFSDLSPERRMEIWMDQFDTASLTIERQIARFQKIKEELGANFVAGVLGIDLSKTKDAAQAIKVIDDRLQDLIPTARALGEAIKPILIFLAALAVLKSGKWIGGALASGKGMGGLGAATGISIGGYTIEQIIKNIGESKKTSESEQYKAYLKTGGKLGPGLYRESLAFGHKTDIGGIELEPIKIVKKEMDMIKQNAIDHAKTEEDIIKLFDYRLLQADRLKVYGFSEIEVAKEKLRLMELHDDASVKDEDIQKQRLAILKLQNEEIITYSENLQKSVSSSINDMMSGKGNLGGLFSNLSNTMGENFRTVVSEGLSKTLIGATGFGELFGETIGGLKGQIESGHKIVYDLVRKGHLDGYAQARGTAASSWAGSAVGTASNGAPIVMGPGGQLITGSGGEVLGGTVPSYLGGDKGGLGAFAAAISKNKTASFLGSAGMLGYSAYNSNRTSGKNQGMSIAGGALIGIGGAMTMAGMGFGGVGAAMTAATAGGAGLMGSLGAGMAAIGPVGWIALASLAAGLAISMFSGKDKQESTSSRTSSSTISSKINVTNKQLELVNRNLIALRTDIRSYILPQSSYFSAKRSLDEEFNISSRMASVQ